MSRGRRIQRRDTVVAIVAVLALLLIRATAPDDSWDHAQPRTQAYAVDLAAGGSWALPRDADGLPTTKPPLHPWLATPFVRAMGPDSWIAHRMPDVLAAVGVAALMVAAGRRWWPAAGGQVGAIAATMWITSLTGAKTSVLARPDMLLTAAVTVAWMVAADASIRRTCVGAAGDARHRWLVGAAAAAGGLAKGPAVLPLALGLWLGMRTGHPAARSTLRRLMHPGVIAVALLPPAIWLTAASAVDAAWVDQGLIRGEFVDRVSGEMADAGGRGPIRLLESVAHMPAYLGIRFLPWSIPMVFAALLAWRPGLGIRPRGRRPADVIVPRIGLGIVIASLVVFTLSSGKRADYLAPCLPAASMAAAWWLVRGDRRLHWTRPWAVPAAAAVLLTVQATHLRTPSNGVPAAAGDAMAEVVHRATEESAAHDLRVITLGSGGTSLAARLGRVPADPPWRFGELVAEGRTFLLAHATLGPTPIRGVDWVMAHPGVESAIALVDRHGRRSSGSDGTAAPATGSWGAWLVLVTPSPIPGSDSAPGSGPEARRDRSN